MRELSDIRYNFLGRRWHTRDNIRLGCALRTLTRDIRRFGLHGLIVSAAAYNGSDWADDSKALPKNSILEDKLETIVEPPTEPLPECDNDRKAPAIAKRSRCTVVGHTEPAMEI